MVSYLNFERKIELFFIETMSKISAISSFVHKSIIPPSPRFSYLAVRSANMRVEILVILCIKKVTTTKAKLLSEIIIISQNCTTYVPWSPNKVTQITLDLKIVIVYKNMCWIYRCSIMISIHKICNKKKCSKIYQRKPIPPNMFKAEKNNLWKHVPVSKNQNSNLGHLLSFHCTFV